VLVAGAKLTRSTSPIRPRRIGCGAGDGQADGPGVAGPAGIGAEEGSMAAALALGGRADRAHAAAGQRDGEHPPPPQHHQHVAERLDDAALVPSR